MLTILLYTSTKYIAISIVVLVVFISTSILTISIVPSISITIVPSISTTTIPSVFIVPSTSATKHTTI